LSVLDNVTLSFLTNVLENYHRLQQQKEEVDRQLATSGTQGKIKEYEYQLTHFENSIAKLEDDVTQARQALASINKEKSKEILESAIQDILKIKVRVND
jgi:DNA anti-recombination protein RmuC